MSEGLEPTKPRSDLGIRTLSGLAMLAIFAAVIWAGGPLFNGLLAVVLAGIVFEYWKLVNDAFGLSIVGFIAIILGLTYITGATNTLYSLRNIGLVDALAPVVIVIAVDIGAYFFGRTFGGPKIAPSISPSKTWSGLFGGIVTAAITVAAYQLANFDTSDPNATLGGVFNYALLVGTFAGVVAQSGDFLESWFKRRAGVKDSGNLIPGHGGLLDRLDGLLAVLFVMGIFTRAGVL